MQNFVYGVRAIGNSLTLIVCGLLFLCIGRVLFSRLADSTPESWGDWPWALCPESWFDQADIGAYGVSFPDDRL